MTSSRGWLLSSYQSNWVRADVVAGVTAAAVVIPQAMGYATIAGLPVEIGLYTCIFPMFVYALLGTSRRLSFSTTSTIVAVTGSALLTAGIAGTAEMVAATATLTMLVGLFLLAFRLLHLGWIVEAISEATVIGLKFGVGLTVIVEQLLTIAGVESAEEGFLAEIWDFASHLGATSGPTALLALSTIVGLVLLKRFAPRVPGALLAVAGGIAGVAWFGLADSGVALITEVPRGLPFPMLPGLDYVRPLALPAVAIAVMAYVETMTASRIARTPDDPPLDNDREFVANGMAAVVGSVFQSLPPAGGFSQTRVNTEAGARTQVSELVTVVLAVAVALFLAPVLSDLPQASLAAVVIVAVAGLLDFRAFGVLWRVDRPEFVAALLTALAAVVFNLMTGVVVGIVLTFYLVVRSLNRPVIVELSRDPDTSAFVARRDGDKTIPGLLIVRIEGGVYTMNVRGTQTEVMRLLAATSPEPSVLLLDLVGTSDTSVTVLDVLRETAQELEKQGVSLWLAAIPSKAAQKIRRTHVYDEWVAQGKINSSVESAVEAFEASHPDTPA